jgi:spore coat polysaccharide biosynthesis protein SpsF
MGSARLPGKVLMPLAGRSVLGHVIARAEQFSEQVVVCTSTEEADDPVEAYCRSQNTMCVRGSLHNVLNRTMEALEAPGVLQTRFFARITADTPLLCPILARFAMGFCAQEVDYIRPVGSPLGTGLELVNRGTFQAVDTRQLDDAHREHVTLWLYEAGSSYRVRLPQAPPELQGSNVRLTLDYPEDFALLSHLFDQWREPSTERVLDHLKNHPQIAQLNRDCLQKTARSKSTMD